MLRRKISEELAEWKRRPFKECLVIKGARQVGKTYSIERFLEESFASHLTLNFDLRPESKRIFEGNLDVDMLMAKIRMEYPDFDPIPGESAIFLDEIQSCPSARTALKSFAQDGRYRVIASGSMLGLSYREVPSYPVGYERIVEMRSLDFEEFLWAAGIEGDTIDYVRGKIRGIESIDPFILDKMDGLFRIFSVVGGMPEAVAAYMKTKDLSETIAIQRKIASGYRDDIGKYSEARERDRIFACFDSIPMQLSEENKKFMFSRIEGDFVPAYATYERGIAWLSDAGIVERCYNVSEPKIPLAGNALRNNFKIYMRDTGLLMSMLGEEAVHAVASGDRRANKGAILENVVSECISKCGHPLFFFSRSQLEVDFITEMRGKAVALEAKSGNNKRAKSLRSVKENYGVGRRAIFEKTNIRRTDDGIEHYPIFACAFIDSMYDPYDTKVAAVDAEEVNARARRLRNGS